MTDEIRVSDADRNVAVEQLGEFFAEGYITMDEFEERSGQVADARTRGQLDELFADLPVTPETNRNPEALARKHEDQAAERELAELQSRKRRGQRAEAVLWSVAFVLFFVAAFVFNNGWAIWLFPLAGIVSKPVRRAAGLSEYDEKMTKELEDKLEQSRIERLHRAAEQRRELDP